MRDTAWSLNYHSVWKQRSRASGLGIGLFEVGEPCELRRLEFIWDWGATGARSGRRRLWRRGRAGGYRRARRLALGRRGAGGRVWRGVGVPVLRVPETDGGLFGEWRFLVLVFVGALWFLGVIGLWLGIGRWEGLVRLLDHGRGGGDHDLRHSEPTVVRGQLNSWRHRLARLGLRRRRRLRFLLLRTPFIWVLFETSNNLKDRCRLQKWVTYCSKFCWGCI